MPSSDISPGHRKRLRERFIKGGLVSFHDYEVVELPVTTAKTDEGKWRLYRLYLILG